MNNYMMQNIKRKSTKRNIKISIVKKIQDFNVRIRRDVLFVLIVFLYIQLPSVHRLEDARSTVGRRVGEQTPQRISSNKSKKTN